MIREMTFLMNTTSRLGEGEKGRRGENLLFKNPLLGGAEVGLMN
jgi:hypothetical protein